MSEAENNASAPEPTSPPAAKEADPAATTPPAKATTAKATTPKTSGKAATGQTPNAGRATQLAVVEPRVTKDVTDNAANPRRAAQTNAGLRDAHAMFHHGGAYYAAGSDVAGDQVAGDKIIQQFGITKTLIAYSIGVEHLRRTRNAFVAPANQDALDEHCDGRRLTILHSPGGWGKNTVALKLLIDRHEQIYGYPADVQLDRIGGSIEQRAGYLIEDLRDAQVWNLNPLVLRDLEAQLEAMDASLIITISDSATLDPDLDRFVAKLEDPPGHESILRSHVDYYLGVTHRDALSPAIMELFQEEVKPGGPRGRAADFARHFCELYQRGPVDPALLRTRMRSAVSGEVQTWFTGLPDLATKCLAISMALFERLPYQVMATAANSLQDRINPPPPEQSINWRQRPDPFLDGRSNRLALLRARTATDAFSAPYGDVPAEIAHYLDPAYPSEIINFVWREYDKALKDLLTWLYEMADNPKLFVRIRAATAVGLISVTNFDQVRDEVIEPWATSRNPRTRDMAAYALKEPGTIRDLRKQVLALVDRWSRDRDPKLRATAARVYGSALGVDMVDRALKELGRLAEATEHEQIAEGNEHEVAFAIGYSLAELIDQDHSRARRIVDLVLDWIRDRRGNRHETGGLTFLTMAGDLIVRPKATNTADTDWPLLLKLSVKDSPLRHTLATAWALTLNDAWFHTSAQTVVGRWAQLAEPDEAARGALAVLLATAAVGDSRTGRIITGMATGWRSDNSANHAPHAAHTVLAALH